MAGTFQGNIWIAGTKSTSGGLSLLLAGYMGIEEELVDQDYPRFLVHRDTWEKMKKTRSRDGFYNIMEINESEMEQQPEDILNLMKYEENRMDSLEESINSLELEETKATMNKDQTIHHKLKTEDIQRMMFENETIWNREQVEKWEDEYVIHLPGTANIEQEWDETELEANMLTVQ